jgi:hypothetical protein
LNAPDDLRWLTIRGSGPGKHGELISSDHIPDR